MRWALLTIVLVAVIAATVGVVRGLQPVLPSTVAPTWYTKAIYPLEHVGVIRATARRYDLDPALVAAIIYTESGFDERARSERGAIGLMQILPDTAQQIARESGGVGFVVSDLENPRVNIRYGCYYMRYALDMFNRDTVAAVASYNAGVGVASRWVTAAQGRRLRIDDIPYPETRAFVQRVLLFRKVYREAYGEQLGRRPPSR